MARIFISYRRDDTAGHAGYLNHLLSQHFGQHDVFRDIDTLEPGIDFVDAIQQEVATCSVLLAMIGRHWLTMTDAQGNRRLDDPLDYVRLEIAAALERNIRVIPILVHGAAMPRADNLPADLAKLSRRNALELRDTTWSDDVKRLIAALERIVPAPARPAQPSEARPGANPTRQEPEATPRPTVHGAQANPPAQSPTPSTTPQTQEQERLLRELNNPATSHERRRDIGDRLATIGDPRPGVGVRDDGVPDIEWLPVAPGGAIEIQDTRFTVQPLFIAKYLITYAQFQAFLDAPDGFNDERWWRSFPGEYVRQAIEQQRTKTANSPRDSVSWYQGVAFARWLNYRLKGTELRDPAVGTLRVGENTAVRLPTEWEWQWAAQNGEEARKYPWGAWQDGYANTGEAGLGWPTAVGMYPHGAGTCGALDMAGNLFEWCLNEYTQPAVADGFGTGKEKVVRGGAFFSYPLTAACAFRHYFSPQWALNPFGLRVVVAPLSGVSGR